MSTPCAQREALGSGRRAAEAWAACGTAADAPAQAVPRHEDGFPHDLFQEGLQLSHPGQRERHGGVGCVRRWTRLRDWFMGGLAVRVHCVAVQRTGILRLALQDPLTMYQRCRRAALPRPLARDVEASCGPGLRGRVQKPGCRPAAPPSCGGSANCPRQSRVYTAGPGPCCCGLLSCSSTVTRVAIAKRALPQRGHRSRPTRSGRRAAHGGAYVL